MDCAAKVRSDGKPPRGLISNTKTVASGQQEETMTAEGRGMRAVLAGMVVLALAWPAWAAPGPMYRGLVAGVSTLEDTVRVLGRPGSRIFRGDRLVCRYRTVSVLVDTKAKKVVAVHITDPAFRDVNGLGVGDPAARVLARFRPDGSGRTAVDPVNSIRYELSGDGLVATIVYTAPGAD